MLIYYSVCMWSMLPVVSQIMLAHRTWNKQVFLQTLLLMQMLHKLSDFIKLFLVLNCLWYKDCKAGIHWKSFIKLKHINRKGILKELLNNFLKTKTFFCKRVTKCHNLSCLNSCSQGTSKLNLCHVKDFTIPEEMRNDLQQKSERTAM